MRRWASPFIPHTAFIIPHLFDQERKSVKVLQSDACATGDGAQRVFGHMDGQFCLGVETLVEATQQGATTGEVDARAVNISGQLGRGLLQGSQFRFSFSEITKCT